MIGIAVLTAFIIISVALGYLHLLMSLDEYAKYQNRNKGHRSFLSWYVRRIGTVLKRELSIRNME